MVTLEKDYWPPAPRLEPRVDSLGLSRDLVEQTLITIDVRAARRANLHKCEAPLIRRIQLEEELDGAEALENAFGVVDAIDANSHKRRADFELIAQGSSFLAHAAMRMQPMPVFLK